MRIVRLEEGQSVPDGSKLIATEHRKGRYLGESIVGHRGIFPFNYTLYRDVYEQVPVYVYEVPEAN